MRPMLKASGTKRLKLNYDKLVSSFASKLNLRRYIKVTMGDVSTEIPTLVGRCRLSPS